MHVLIFLSATIFVGTESGKFTAICFVIYSRDFRVNDTFMPQSFVTTAPSPPGHSGDVQKYNGDETPFKIKPGFYSRS